MTTQADADSSGNPLPDCPSTPNCLRRSVHFDLPSDSLLAYARRALSSMDPEEIIEIAPNRISSVHRVVVFRDDLDFQVDAVPGGSVLHVRSASREGTWDLGVNRLRVWRFLRLVRREAAR